MVLLLGSRDARIDETLYEKFDIKYQYVEWHVKRIGKKIQYLKSSGIEAGHS